MSAPINDGGTAFPKGQEFGTHGDLIDHATPGMSLRDYFAAKAMSGWLASFGPGETCAEEEVAEMAYRIADLMMKARSA